MNVLIIAEHDNQLLKSVNRHVVTAAQQFSTTIDMLVVGSHCETVIQQAAQLPGISRILKADAEDFAHQLPENIAPLIADIAKPYAVVLASATTFGKNILPRAAALLDVSMISDVVKILSEDTFVRPIYAGNALATVQSLDTIKFLTVRTTAFAPIKEVASEPVPITTINTVYANTQSYFVSHELTVSSRPELTSARIVISGGRGLKSSDNFKILEQLAESLGAALGASRAAVDAGFVPNDYQVGQTGKIVAPDLYIAVGISGAIQHLAGMKDSKVIVAINNDPEAPIFQVADYGLVGDLFKLVPELNEALAKG